LNKIGLKLWNTNTDNYLDIARGLYCDAIFDYIELYVVPDNLEKISHWKKLNIPFDIHAPHSAHGMNLANCQYEKANMLLYSDVKKYADELGARYVVFHGGVDGDCNEVARQLFLINDSRALIENKPYKPLKFVTANKYIGVLPSEIELIRQKVSCGFCLDIGHAICAANSYKNNPYDFITQFVKLAPQKIHLSDMKILSEDDMHLNFGFGDVNFNKLFSEILPKDIDITIETAKNSNMDLNDFIADVNFLRKIIRGALCQT